MSPLQDLFADLRFAARTFRRSPTFTITAVLSLALGIGANSAIFTALDTVLWKPLPVQDPHRLVRLLATRAKDQDLTGLPSGFIEHLRRADILSDLAIFSNDGLSFSYDGRAERIVLSIPDEYSKALALTSIAEAMTGADRGRSA